MKRTYSIICASNNEAVLNDNLLRSKHINDHQLILRMNGRNVPAMYNDASKESKHEIEIYVHHDVYLKDNFFKELDAAIDKVNKIDKNWGVLGVAGARWHGRFAGYVDDNNHQLRWTDDPVHGTRLKKEDFPYRVQTLDELLLVKRKKDFEFDTAIPSGHHLFGADLCMQARSVDRINYVVNALCRHNSNWDRQLHDDFMLARRYLARKWHKLLPIGTTVTHITEMPDEQFKSQSLAPIQNNMKHNYIKQNRYGYYFVPESQSERPASQVINDAKVWLPKTLDYLCAEVRGMNVVVAGTYFGSFLPAIARSTSNTVYAFEAVDHNYNYTAATVELNNIGNVELTNKALLDQDGKTPIVYKTGDNLLGGASYIPDELVDVSNSKEVECVKLDSLKHIRRKKNLLIYLGVNYTDTTLRILRGSRKILSESSPKLVITDNMSPTILDFLEKLGYTLTKSFPEDNTHVYSRLEL